MTRAAFRPESDARDRRQIAAAKTTLAPHPSAALEYWFFKVNAGPTALLVDWIARRRVNEHWLRVSIHSLHKREVLFEKRAVLMPDEHDCLGDRRTAGRLGEVSWELDIDPGTDWIAPDIFPARLLRMPDLSGVSAPLATFSGWIRHAGHHVAVQDTPGVVCQYWGRQLPSEWWWVSASQFDQPGLAVECYAARSAAWGVPVGMPLAYLYLRHKGKKRLVMAPFNLARARGSPESFEIKIRRPGARTVTLIGTGRDYGNLGDGIINTLVGDLEVRQGRKLIGRAQGTAGLECRAPEHFLPTPLSS
jgi:hypothetical protein